MAAILTAAPDLLVYRLCERRGESHAARPTESVRLIVHRARVAALAAERVYYAPHVEALEPDHPERRFVAALCLYSHAVDNGQARCSYDQGEAECFARALLMPTAAFERVIAWSDLELAELFTVPLDQVAQRRTDYVAPH
jgi:hypothetical protein